MSSFEDSILRVLKGDSVVGAAFLVSDRLVATCAHVVGSAGADVGGKILLRSPDGEEIDAIVESKFWRDVNAEDVSILRSNKPIENIQLLALGSSSGTKGHNFSTFGFPRMGQELVGAGEIIGHASIHGLKVLQLRSPEVTPGFSGAPIFDEIAKRIVGMVVAITPPDEYQRLGTTAFAIPSETICEVCPELKLIAPKRKRHKRESSAPNETLGYATRLIYPNIVNYLHRPRLTEKINTTLAQKSVFIRADAGYGKTWLIKDFIDTVSPHHIKIWYSFSKSQSEILRLVQDIASDVYEQSKTVGVKTMQLAKQREKETGAIARPNESLSLLLNEMTTATDLSFILILEDLHNITDDVVHSTIVALLESRPQNLQVILTSRNSLPLSQVKLAMHGHLLTLEQSDLAFDLEEIREYLASIKKAILSPKQIGMLHRRTEGWPAALSLGREFLESGASNIQEISGKLSGFEGNIYSFFAEEVYRSFSNDTKTILKRLSIARSITPDIVDLFSGRSDGGQVLKDLSGQNTFLVEVNNEKNRKRYQLHTLFAEFLETKLIDEEGIKAVSLVHRQLARFYLQNGEHFRATEHAIDGEDWQIAVKSLEHVGPLGVSMGYGKAFLIWAEKIPMELSHRSAQLCETTGQAYLQSGDYNKAADMFSHAQTQYKTNNNEKALNRLEYLSAETLLNQNKISAEDFLKIASKVSQRSYRQNETFLGAQVELRLIQVGTILVTKYKNVFQELVDRSVSLIQRIEQLGSDYDLIRAKILAAQAHLTFEATSFIFKLEVNKVLLREKLGHPIELEERAAMARQAITGIQATWDLYKQAKNIAEGKSEIEWAIIHAQHLRDYSYHIFQTISTGAVRNAGTTHTLDIDQETKNYLLSMLVEYEKCVAILEKYELAHILAKTLCEAAAIYDLLGNVEERNRLANISLQVASEKGFTDILQQAQNIIQNNVSFVETVNNLSNKSSDEFFASLSEEQKSLLIENMLRAISDPSNIDIVRRAISIDVEDAINVAKQRISWCRHVQIIQDLRHTQSLETFYRSMPEKRIVCAELHYQSPNSGHSFDELWPMFKGVFCLTCTKRSLR